MNGKMTVNCYCNFRNNAPSVKQQIGEPGYIVGKWSFSSVLINKVHVRFATFATRVFQEIIY